VKTYKVQVGNTMTSFDDVDGGKVFTGNSNRSTQIEQKFAKPVMARYVRIWPQSWQGHVSMRAAVLVADCVPAEEPEKELPELPTDPGCYVHAPKGCAKRPAMNDDWFSDSHSGSATNKARCEQRAAEYDKWCPTTGTLAEFVPEHNCMTREAWSDEKKEWCCANKKLGCPEPEPEEGGYVCQETTSIFGGSRYANFNIVTKDGCAAKCDNDARCKSFDFATTPGKFACRLSKMDKPHTAAVPSRTFCKPGAEAEDPTNPTDKECQSKTSKNGCLERHCGFNESTGKCNKRCRKYGKAECPAGRCKVEGDDCTDPEDPEQEECEPKESKNGCLMRNCGWNEETGKCNKKCRKFGKAECPAGRCKVEGDNCTDPEDPEQDECEPKESKNGCIMRNCGWNEKTGKCNKRCRKFGKAECPAGRCKVEVDNCTDPEDPEQDECEPRESKNGCLLRNCGWNEKTGKCNRRCHRFSKAKCPKGRCKVEGDNCTDPHDPTQKECESRESKNGCVMRHCGWNEKTGKCNRNCNRFGKGDCPKTRCRVNGEACEDIAVELTCDDMKIRSKCNAMEGCKWQGGKCNGGEVTDCGHASLTRAGLCNAVSGCRFDRKQTKCLPIEDEPEQTCEDQISRGRCNAKPGCAWRAGKCLTGSGEITDCNDPSLTRKPLCVKVKGCSWNNKSKKCGGAEAPKEKTCADMIGRSKCNAMKGCSYDKAKKTCSAGGAADCSSLSKKSQCVKESACAWSGSPTTGSCGDKGAIVEPTEIPCAKMKRGACEVAHSKCTYNRKANPKCQEKSG